MDLWRDTPLWALRILVDELPAIEAAQLQARAQAAAFPYLKDGDRRGLVHEWRALTRPRGYVRGEPPTATAPAEPAASDPAAAAAYFAAMGARVVRAEP